jgi:exonuclease 3'-5' domain-containing protein 1
MAQSVVLPLINTIDFRVVNDQQSLTKFKYQQSSCQSISVDLEGENLCRDGRITVIQIYMPQNNLVYLFDCIKLSKNELTMILKPIFESNRITKYFFDCRADVDALYHQYGINVMNVIDVQLYEIGYRKSVQHRYNQNGLNYYSGLYASLKNWSKRLKITEKELKIKEEFCNRFNEKKYDMDLNEENVKWYLAIDVIYLDKLAKIFSNKIKSNAIVESILAETQNRVEIWKKPIFARDNSKAISVI